MSELCGRDVLLLLSLPSPGFPQPLTSRPSLSRARKGKGKGKGRREQCLGGSCGGTPPSPPNSAWRPAGRTTGAGLGLASFPGSSAWERGRAGAGLRVEGCIRGGYVHVHVQSFSRVFTCTCVTVTVHAVSRASHVHVHVHSYVPLVKARNEDATFTC